MDLQLLHPLKIVDFLAILSLGVVYRDFNLVSIYY